MINTAKLLNFIDGAIVVLAFFVLGGCLCGCQQQRPIPAAPPAVLGHSPAVQPLPSGAAAAAV